MRLCLVLTSRPSDLDYSAYCVIQDISIGTFKTYLYIERERESHQLYFILLGPIYLRVNIESEDEKKLEKQFKNEELSVMYSTLLYALV